MHELGNVRGDVLAPDGSKFAKTHQDIGGDRWIAIIGLWDKHTEDGEGIWFDESLCRTDEQGEKTGAVLAVASVQG